MRVFTTALAACAIAVASTDMCAASDVQTGSEAQLVGNEAETLTREEWKARVDQAKLRAREFIALAKSGKLLRPDRSAEKIAEEASATVMNDQSLRHGDIVATNKGLFRFNGASDSDPQPTDFTPLTLDTLSAPQK